MGLLSARSSASCWCTYGIHDLPCHRDILLSCLPLTCVHGCSFFNNLWDKFDEIDSSGDRRLSVDEFIAGCGVVGERLSGSEAEAEFALIDSNHGGYVLFDEFCTWCASRQVLEDDDDDDATADAAQAAAPAPEPEPEPEPVRPVSPKSKRHIARLEMPGRSERDELFRRMDYNGNNTLSLAEIDKAVIEIWPQFNHKPALMRAHQAAGKHGGGFVEAADFRRLLHFIAYFTELWELFAELDAGSENYMGDIWFCFRHKYFKNYPQYLKMV